MLNIDDNSSRFSALIEDLCINKSKTVDILISDLWDQDIRAAYQKIELGRVAGELAGFENVFKNKSHKNHIDKFVEEKCISFGGSYGDICSRLKIRKIEMLMDTFWFVDPDPSMALGNMMMIPMTGSEGSTRPVFYINAKENGPIFNYYYRLCRGGFDTMSKPLWP